MKRKKLVLSRSCSMAGFILLPTLSWLLFWCLLLLLPAFAFGTGLDITSSADWDVRGTASFSSAGLIFGDNLGYDTQDGDHDGNYQNNGKSGSRIDYDFAIGKTFFEPPLVIAWQGCLPVTRYGYNMFGLGNLANGGIFRQAVFQTRWEKQSSIQVWAESAGHSYLSGITPRDNSFCASYKLDWDQDGFVTFYYNDQQVFKSIKAIKGPLVFFTRTFEKSGSVSSLTAEGGTGAPPVIESCVAEPDSGQVTFDSKITCSGSGSGALSWEWDWDGDGSADETTSVAQSHHTYSLPGTYQVGVTLTDGAGSQARTTVQVVALDSGASDIGGSVGGSFEAALQLEDGTTRPLNGGVSGSWNASLDGAGNVTGTAEGTFGADGISGAFTVSYNSATGALSGYWGPAGGDILSNPLVFTRVSGDGLHFTADISGIAPTQSGGLPFNGHVQIELLGAPELNLQGTMTGDFTTDIAYEVNGTLTAMLGPVQIVGTVPVNLSGTVPTTGAVAGRWQASVADGSLTGDASGDFHGTVSTAVTTPYGDYPINIPYSGTWQGTLGMSGQQVVFTGSWVEPHVQAIGNASSSFGGSFGITVDDASGTWPLPITFTCPESGGEYVDPSTGLVVHWTIRNFYGTGTLAK